MSGLDAIGASVRRHDPDRFLAALFAPPARRPALFLLYAFNHELARAREVAREPMLALIRLQWWREVVAGAPRAHALATQIQAALAAGTLGAGDLGAMIDGREAEAGEVASLAEFEHLVRTTAGALAVAAGRALGAAAELPRLEWLGTAYGIAGQLRSVPSLARQGRCLLPSDLLAAEGLTPEAVVARPDDPRLRPILAALADRGRRLLAEAGGRLPRPLLAAALPAVLARRDLRHPAPPAGPRGVGARLAMLAAFVAGRV